MLVSNLVNNNGNPVRNQFIISGNGRQVFQSYETAIASINADGINIIKDWEISKTTSKYLFQFLREASNLDLNTAKLRKLQTDSHQSLINFVESIY